MGQDISASVIIGTFNRVDLLRRALKSLARQTARPETFEVIVIDDGSDDGTGEVIREFSLKHASIHGIMNSKNLGLSSARNKGLAAATGKFILFTDDDCIAREDWVERMCVCLGEHPVVAGAVDSPKSGCLRLSHNIAHFHPFMPGRRSGPVDFLAGANMGFQRRVLEGLKGFDERRKLAGDTQLCFRARSAGYVPFLTQEAVVIHDPEYITLPGAVKSSYEHAETTILLRNEFASLLGTPYILKSPALLRLLSPLIAPAVTAKIYCLNPRLLKRFRTLPLVWLLKLIWCWGAASGLKKAKKKDRNQRQRAHPDAAA